MMGRYIPIMSLAFVLAGVLGCVPAAPSITDTLVSRRLVDQGIELFNAGKFDRAREAFESSLGIAELPEAYDGLGSLMLLEGRFDDAEKLFDAAVAHSASYNEVYGNLALLHEMAGRYEKARNFYEEAVRRNSQNPFILNNYAAFLRERLGDVPGSIAHLRRAADLYRDEIVLHNLRIVGRKP